MLGVERVSRRSGGSNSSPLSEYMLCLYLPFVGLSRAHPISNFVVKFSEFVDWPDAESFKSQPDIPGYDAWIVHTTPAGCQWLTEAPGQYLAAGLSDFDLEIQIAFSMSGRLIIARGPTFGPKHLQDIYAQLQWFYSQITQAQQSEPET